MGRWTIRGATSSQKKDGVLIVANSSLRYLPNIFLPSRLSSNSDASRFRSYRLSMQCR
jgi:hypothetical protein